MPGAAGPDVPASATLRRRCATSEEALAMAQALNPDNAHYLVARCEGEFLVLEAKSGSVGELQRTLDDALACLSAAERTWETARGTAAGHPSRPSGPSVPPAPEPEDEEGPEGSAE